MSSREVPLQEVSVYVLLVEHSLDARGSCLFSFRCWDRDVSFLFVHSLFCACDLLCRTWRVPECLCARDVSDVLVCAANMFDSMSVCLRFACEQMSDGSVQDGHKVLSARKRLGMVGVLAVVAGTAVFFNAEEQAAEAKIWDSEMAGDLCMDILTYMSSSCGRREH